MKTTRDGAWMEMAEFNQLTGGALMTETMWRCDQVRAGQLYNRMLFDTREEAMQFVQRMQRMEPDQTFSVEAIEARQVLELAMLLGLVDWNEVQAISTSILVMTSVGAIGYAGLQLRHERAYRSVANLEKQLGVFQSEHFVAARKRLAVDRLEHGEVGRVGFRGTSGECVGGARFLRSHRAAGEERSSGAL